MIRLFTAALLLFSTIAPAFACQWGRAAWAEPQRRAAAAQAGDGARPASAPPAAPRSPS